MVRKVRLLTDSMIKKGKALAVLEATVLKEELVANRKKVQFRSDYAKVEVVKTYLALGANLTLTSSATGVPLRTLHLWKSSTWWKNLVNEIKKVEKLELSAKTKAILDRSLDQIIDRLDNGDIILNQKTGTIERKKLSARDLNQITKDIMDRKLILDRAFEEKVVEVDKGDRLAALAERFANLAEATLENTKKRPVVEVTDVVFVKEEVKHNATS